MTPSGMVSWFGGGAEELDPADVVGVRDESVRAFESSWVVMPTTLESKKEVNELMISLKS